MKKNHQKGFTLIEVIVSIAIMTLILVPLCSIMITNSKSIINTNENNDLQEKALQIMSAFRTHCLYTRNVEKLTVGGTNRLSYIFDSASNETTGGQSFELTVDKPSDTGVTRTVYSYSNAGTGIFTITDNGDTKLTVEDVIVNIQPVTKKGLALSFDNAAGINVTVALSRNNTKSNSKIELKELGNSFYFRNSGVDINDLTRTPSPEADLAKPTPVPGHINKDDDFPSTVPSTSASPSVSPSATDDSGGGGSESPAPSSSSSPAPASPTPTTTPTPATPAPTPTTTPKPTTAPTQTPTPTPTPIPNNSASIRIDCDGTYWRVYDSAGTLKHTYEIPSWQNEFRLEFYDWGVQAWWFQWSPTLSDYGITNYATSSMDITFTGSGTTPIGVLVSNNFAKFSIRNNSSYIVTVQNTACTNAYVTFPGQPTEKLPNDSATYSILPSSN